MPRHPKEPLLFLIATDDGRQLAAVMAMSGAEARDFYVENNLEVSRPTPAQAYALGQFGDVALLYAKPEYATPPPTNQSDLFVEVVDAEFTPPHYIAPIE